MHRRGYGRRSRHLQNEKVKIKDTGKDGGREGGSLGGHTAATFEGTCL